jgi:hypothetical protein
LVRQVDDTPLFVHRNKKSPEPGLPGLRMTATAIANYKNLIS